MRYSKRSDGNSSVDDLWLLLAVGGAEDPEKILDQAVNEMQSDLIKMRQSSAQVIGF